MYDNTVIISFISSSIDSTRESINESIKEKFYFSFVGEIDWLIVELFFAPSYINQRFMNFGLWVIYFGPKELNQSTQSNFTLQLTLSFIDCCLPERDE